MPAIQPYGKRITEEVRRYCGTYTYIPGGGAGDGRAGLPQDWAQNTPGRKDEGMESGKTRKGMWHQPLIHGYIKRGIRRMSLDTFVRICEVLQKDMHALVRGTMCRHESGLTDMWESPELRDAANYRIM